MCGSNKGKLSVQCHSCITTIYVVHDDVYFIEISMCLSIYVHNVYTTMECKMDTFVRHLCKKYKRGLRCSKIKH